MLWDDSPEARLKAEAEGFACTDLMKHWAMEEVACLGLHERATARQLRRSIELLQAQAEARPDEAASLHGLLALLRRLDRERVARWAQQRKAFEGRKKLSEEKVQLSERLALLEQQAEQDRVRIEELQKQIEQLKNIETIIKNRER